MQSDSGGRIVVPFLRGEGVGRLDGMVVSHDDNDHAGGMSSLLSQIQVAWLKSSLPDSKISASEVEHEPCTAGQSWTWDEVRFDMLHPAQDNDGNQVKDNDRSCVLRISSRHGSLLLPGDIERDAERHLVGSYKLTTDVLVVPHHGSKTSSTEGFIGNVQPQIAIFTVGYLNRFGHPKEAVMERYRRAGSQLYRTDQHGALLIKFSKGTGIDIRRWRSEARRYWHDAAEGGAGLLAEIKAAR